MEDVDGMGYEQVLDFRGEAGRRVWDNVCDATGLLACADYRAEMLPPGPARLKLENDLIAFLILAAFRHTYDGPQYVWNHRTDLESYPEDVAERRDRNPHCLKLYQASRTRALEFAPDRRGRPLPVGLLDGYSCVEPLERDLFDEMVDRDAEELLSAYDDYGGMVAGVEGEPPAPHPCLYVQSVVHLPSLGQEPARRQVGSHRVMRRLFRHVASFLPPFAYDDARDLFVPRSGEELPRFICSRDGRLMADRLIQGLGCSPSYTRDEVGDDKFVLDFRAYNARAVDPETAGRIRRAYRHLKPYLGR